MGSDSMGEPSSVDPEKALVPVKGTADQDVSSNGRYGTSKIWTLYNEKAKTHDTVLVTRIKGSMDSILVFAGLFSAVVTAFIIESYKMLNPDSSDITVFYLAQISQDIVQLSGRAVLPSSTLPPPFTATPQSVAVNILWILSLIASLACALGATLIQAWTSRYLRVVARSPDVVVRARNRAWHFEGMKKSQMEAFAAGVPAVLHIALFLFLVGLVVFLFPVNHQVAYASMGAAIACGVIYLTFAVMDIFVSNSPYQTPFSVFLSAIVFGSIGLVLASVAFGLTLGLAVIVLAIPLALISVIIPCLPIVYFMVGPKTVATAWKEFRAKEPPKLPAAASFNRQGFKSAHVVNRVMGRPPGKPKQDVKALHWLLEHITTTSELEDFVEGIELFVERSTYKAQYSKIVLELGGTEVGSFSAGLGVCIGHLLESCTHTGSEALSLDHKRSRALSTTRALLSVFLYTEPKERTASLDPDHAPYTFKRDLMRYGFPSTRWLEWIDVGLWDEILTLRNDEDQDVALHISYLSLLILHRALVDMASRLRSREVQIRAPGNWNLRTLLAGLHSVSDDRLELYELAIAIHSIPELEDRPDGIEVKLSLPEGWKKESHKGKDKGRPILVAVRQANAYNQAETQRDADFPFVSHETFRNEAMLITLIALLSQVPRGTSLSHSDILSNIICSVAEGGSAKETDITLQREFLESIEAHRKACETPTANSGPRSGFARATVRSLFHMKLAMNALVPIIQSVQPDKSFDGLKVRLVKHIQSIFPPNVSKFKNQKALREATVDALASNKEVYPLDRSKRKEDAEAEAEAETSSVDEKNDIDESVEVEARGSGGETSP